MRDAIRVLLLAFSLLAAPASWAQGFSGCWNQGAAGIAFGTVSIDTGSDAAGSVTLGCQSGASAGFLRYCLYLPEGAPLGGIAPRRMTNYAGSALLYDLYSDASRTSIIGPPPSGGGYPVYSGVVAVAGSFSQVLATIPVYGRVRGGQNVPAGNYQSQLSNSTLAWAFSPTSAPEDCTQSPSRGSVSFYFDASAAVPNNCRIGLATDLDFGTHSPQPAVRDSTSTIIVRCPAGTPWSLGLGNGANNVAGVRRMQSASGSYALYELYKDVARSQRWGSAGPDLVTGVGQGIATPQISTVYGRVPLQSPMAPGNYQDSIIVTLTY